MPSLTFSNRLIWFAHCPKAGGTSVEQFMVAHWGEAVGHLHWGWDVWWKDGGWRVADPPNSPQHLVWEDALRSLPRAPDTVFAVVRDPVARMASEYRWQRHARRGSRLSKLLARLPFSVWIRVMLALVRHHPHGFDNHIRPQADFIPDGARVFRLEDGLDPVLRWLAHETGLQQDIAVPHAIPSGARAQRIRPVDKARIAALHAADYTRFGYERPSSDAPPPDIWDWCAKGLARGLAFLDRRGAL